MFRKRALALSQAVPGMILAEAVRDPGGVSLLAGGATLTNDTLASLQRRGVEHLLIVEETTLTPEQATRQQEEIGARVNALFRQCPDEPLMVQLREVLLAYRLGNMV